MRVKVILASINILVVLLSLTNHDVILQYTGTWDTDKSVIADNHSHSRESLQLNYSTKEFYWTYKWWQGLYLSTFYERRGTFNIVVDTLYLFETSSLVDGRPYELSREEFTENPELWPYDHYDYWVLPSKYLVKDSLLTPVHDEEEKWIHGMNLKLTTSQ